MKTTSQLPTKLQVKFSGDGTHIVRSMHVINFTFTALEEMSQRNSPAGNHTSAILKTSEQYENLCVSPNSTTNLLLYS